MWSATWNGASVRQRNERSRADARLLFFRMEQAQRWRLGSTSLSLSRMAWTAFSVVAQSMQASVMETPYLRSHRFLGMLWLPQPRWLSTIRPMIELLPSTIWLVTFSMTSGCRAGSLLELAWLQSIMMFGLMPLLVSSCSHSATLTES